MGAWGEGMQANDTALDAIGSAGLGRSEPRKREKMLSDLRNGKISVKTLFTASKAYGECGWIVKDSQAILGLAEHLFDEGLDIKPVRALITKALRDQLLKTNLSSWRSPSGRKSALLRFKARLSGKRVSSKALELDNEGLLSRMAKLSR